MEQLDFKIPQQPLAEVIHYLEHLKQVTIIIFILVH